MLFFGIIFLIVAVVCFVIARNQLAQMRAMAVAETNTAALIGQIHSRVSTSIGADALAEQCEVEGLIECDNPLQGPYSNQVLVAFSRSVTREYEEDVTSTNDKGEQTSTTERRSETLESEERRVPFYVRDSTGRVLVDAEGAELDWQETADRYEDAAPQLLRTRTRTLGKRYTERGLPVGVRVYILGCVIDRGGQPIVARNPHDRKARFLVSRKSERELLQAAAGTARTLNIVAAVSALAGVVLLIANVIFM